MADVDMYEESDYESDDFYDDDSDASFDEENVVVASKPKAAAKKSSASKKSVLAPSQNVDNVPKAKASGKGGKGKKTIEEIYQKKTQLEHILLRPDTYIGSVESVTQPMFVLDEDTGRLVQRDVTFTPGLYKIFDEIIVNASDNKQRDPNMDKLEVVVDAEANQISVKNNGKGIPVEMHKEEKCYVPTLIFGHLLTGSNFDDEDKKTTGGRNGYGAKLANIFSHEFIVECVDTNNQLKFKQVFRDNMSVAEEPVIKSLTAKELKQGDYTKITFSPDLERFNMHSLDRDTVGLLSKRAYDIAGSMANRGGKKLTVTLNGNKVPVKSFKDYLNLLDGVNKPVAYAQISDRWEVGVSVSEGTFQQVSFVNSISTSKGGSHVSYIADMIGSSLVNVVKKKNKGGVAIKPNQIKNHLCVFVNALIENPTFDSQTKENLTSKKKDFGSTCELSDEFLKKVHKSDIVENILQFARFKERQALSRKNGVKKSKLTGIVKLDDANFAGTAKSKDCTLIITEGDSAKSLAMSGLSVVGRDYYGVYPLKGKPLNVRDATHKQMMNNEEMKNLLDIMGLKFDTVYDENNIKTLRYGHLMIMADQDHDGSHIKGLVINFIHKLWPSLLDIPGFLQQFITPIVKATKGKKSKTFFTLPEYESWRESTGNDAKGWKIKYYKGLGTSTSAEAKEYFSNLDLHEVLFDTLSDDKVEAMEVDDVSDDDMDFGGDKPASKEETTGSDLIDMVFNKKRVDDRKAWLNTVEKDTYLDYSAARDNGVKYSDFINREFILFSQNDNARSIPHVMDGFKPSQRKVLFACFKRKLKGEIKVAQLAGYIGEHSAYHHGEASLNEAIVGMAQNFVGSNNLNLLTPSGQFGTRRMGGKDHASVRYIFTTIEKVTRTIFHPDDDALLNYLADDGLSIEPDFYMPVIPMILVNGSTGIGTGYSSSVPNFDPRAIIANIRHLIAGDEQEKLVPYYHGFKGEIVETKNGSYSVKGKIERTSDTSLLITELPLKKWTQDYKLFLEGMMESKKGDPEIKDFQENHTDTTVSFVVNATKENIDAFEKEKNGLLGKFKLTSSLATSNMTLFDSEGHIVKYDSPEQILSSFFDMRLEYYEKRKELLLRKMRREQKMLSNKSRFVLEVCEGELVVSNRKRTDILADLQERGYDVLEKEDDEQANDGEESGTEEDDSATDAELARGYEYLLGMKIWSLTYEKAQALREQLAEKTQEVADLEETPPSQIWLNDLDSLEEALDERDAAMDAAEQQQVKAVKKNKKHQAKKKAAKKSKKTKKGEWDSDISDSESEDDMDMSDSDDDFAPAKKAPARKRTTVPKKPAAASKPKPKAVVKQAPVAALPVAMEAEESDDDDVEVSLFDRLKKNNAGASLKEAAPAIKSDDEDSFGSLDTSKFEAASLTPAPKKKAATKRGRSTAAAKKKTTTAAKKTTTAAKKPARRVAKKKIVEDEFEFNSDSDDSDVQVVNVSPVPARGRSGRNIKKISYSFSSSSDSDSDFE